MYDYNKSIKSSASDELINTYLLRPVAGLLVRVLYPTSISPNQVTIASIVAGVAAALGYVQASPVALVCAGLLVTLKDLLDSVDGQLARAREQYSRIGRFLDSIGDFIVDAAVFGAIGWMLGRKHGGILYPVLAFAGFWGITFRVSYHVFYQASFLHMENLYQNNRTTEEIREEDTSGDRRTLVLQQIFQFLYGWQDALVKRIDEWSQGPTSGSSFRRMWYSDEWGIRLSGLLGMGTELFLVMLFSVLNELELYIYANLLMMNGILLGNIIYRRARLRSSITHRSIESTS
jgi:phosphatidylglycerophosphate synthase